MKKPAKRPIEIKTPQTKPMFGIRLATEERRALEKAAKEEDRPMAYVARRAILDWLKEKGFLK